MNAQRKLLYKMLAQSLKYGIAQRENELREELEKFKREGLPEREERNLIRALSYYGEVVIGKKPEEFPSFYSLERLKTKKRLKTEL